MNAVSRAIQVYNPERELYYKQQLSTVQNVLEKLLSRENAMCTIVQVLMVKHVFQVISWNRSK